MVLAGNANSKSIFLAVENGQVVAPVTVTARKYAGRKKNLPLALYCVPTKDMSESKPTAPTAKARRRTSSCRDSSGMTALGLSTIDRPNGADEVACLQIDPGQSGGSEDLGVVFGRDHSSISPGVDGRARQVQHLGQPAGTEPIDHLDVLQLVPHGEKCTKSSNALSTNYLDGRGVGKIVHSCPMGKPETPDSDLTPLALAIRNMRKKAKLSVRELADEAGFTRHSSYSYYEGPKFVADEVRKGPRTKIAKVLLAHGVPKAEVAQMGRLPEGIDATSEAISTLAEQVAELKAIVLGKRKAS